MPNVIVLVKEDRVRRQIEQLLAELDLADLRYASFKTEQEFKSLYFKDATTEAQPDPAAEEAGSGGGAELKLFSQVDMVIFALDTISGKTGPWIDGLRVNLRKYKRFPQTSQLRLMAIKYEEDNINKIDLVHPFLDDLIYLPIDRLVFLQKTQILLSLPRRTAPRWLFSQEVRQEIEISKIVKMDRLSDVALAIRNPVPLKPGVPAHLYVQLPGEKTRLEVYGKVLRSVPHPDVAGQYLVYFSYFGLSRNDLGQIRRALAKAPNYKSLLTDDREAYRYDPNDWSMNQDLKEFGIAIVDSDGVSGNTLGRAIQNEMDCIKVITENSYQVFLHRYLDGGGSTAAASPPRTTDETDFYSSVVSLSVSVRDLGCLSIDPGPTNEDFFLGHPAHAVFSSPEKWLELVQETESRLMIEEAVELIKEGRILNKVIAMQDAQNQARAVNFKMYGDAADGVVTVELTPASMMDVVNKLTSDSKNKSLDAMVVDGSFVPEDPGGWMNGIRDRAVQVGLAKTQRDVKFILLSDSPERPAAPWLNNPDLLGLLLKPVDARQLLFLLSEHLPNNYTLFQFQNLGWAQPGLPAHISKSVELEALSEYGATLKMSQAMHPGTVVYLRKSIYENAPNNCLAARVYACEPYPGEKGWFQIYVTYFGINDAFLKYARTWIRENYAQQKKREG